MKPSAKSASERKSGKGGRKPPRAPDETGNRHGRLTVVGRVFRHPTKAYWECICDCGTTVVVRGDGLRGGGTSSCGCLRKERALAAVVKHGRYKDSIYKIWKGINERCLNPRRKEFHRYGGRGITVCDRWHRGNPDGFENFLSDMGERPGELSIDRIDSDGPYSPENCRWATRKEQQNNRSSNRLFTFEGRTQNITQWSLELKIKSATVFSRMHRGKSIAEALGLPGGGDAK